MDDVRVDGRNALGQGDGVTRGEVDVDRKNLNDDEVAEVYSSGGPHAADFLLPIPWRTGAQSPHDARR